MFRKSLMIVEDLGNGHAELPACFPFVPPSPGTPYRVPPPYGRGGSIPGPVTGRIYDFLQIPQTQRGFDGNGSPLGLHPGIIGSSPIPSTKILPALNEWNSNQIRNSVNITMMSGSKGASFVFEIGE